LVGKPLSQSYGTSTAVRTRSVTCHPTQVNASRFNPSKLVLDLPTLGGWKVELTVDVDGWLHTQMVYWPADGQPSKYQPGPTTTTCRDPRPTY